MQGIKHIYLHTLKTQNQLRKIPGREKLFAPSRHNQYKWSRGQMKPPES